MDVSTGKRQLGLFAAAYVLYDLGRWVTNGAIGAAKAHALWILALEHDAGVAVQRSVQHALGAGPVLWVLSNVYLAAQLAVLPAALVYLYRRAPRVYRRLRDTVLATWLLAIPVYAAFPVAPPRLAGIGVGDTVSHQAALALTGRSTLFYNELAAVPSLHCGFAVAVGVALAVAARRRVVRGLWLLWGPLVCVAVVATGNHYVFDIAAGLLAAIVGCVIGPLPARMVRLRGSGPRGAAPAAVLRDGGRGVALRPCGRAAASRPAGGEPAAPPSRGRARGPVAGPVESPCCVDGGGAAPAARGARGACRGGARAGGGLATSRAVDTASRDQHRPR